MATTNPAYARLVLLRRNGTALTNLKSTSLQQPRATRDVTTKDSADEQEIRPTLKESRTIPFEILITNAASGTHVGVAQFQDDYTNGNVVVWKQGDGVSGSPYWTGSGFLTKFDVTFGMENVEGSGEIKTTGPVTFGYEA